MDKNLRWISRCLVPVLIFLAGCSRNNEFRLKGEFTVNDTTSVTLYNLLEEQKNRVDTAFVTDKFFELRGNLEYPGIFELDFFNDQKIYLIIFPGDRLRLTIDNLHSEISYYVEKSPESKRIKELIDAQSYVLKQIDQLSIRWEESRTDTVERRKIDSTYYSIMQGHREYTLDFIHQQPGSLANILALYQNFGRKSQPLFDRYDDLDVFSFVDSCLIGEYPHTQPVLALNKEVNEIHEQIRQKKYIEKVVEAGRLIPPLTFPDIHNDTLSIRADGGKPVLILFWATWNPYSVKELLTLDNFYMGKVSGNLQIVTISIDSDREELLKFVRDNEIHLPIICDYNYWDSDLIGKYAVKRIPSTLLTNKEGIIVAKDIFSDELLKRINDIVP